MAKFFSTDCLMERYKGAGRSFYVYMKYSFKKKIGSQYPYPSVIHELLKAKHYISVLIRSKVTIFLKEVSNKHRMIIVVSKNTYKTVIQKFGHVIARVDCFQLNICRKEFCYCIWGFD